MHGGALDAAMALYGGSRAEWLDLSTGINPVPTPYDAPPERAWTRLPEDADRIALEDAARSAYGVPFGVGIAAVPGTQAALQILPRLFEPTEVAVVGPTYGEHSRCWAMAGHIVQEVESPVEAEILVVVNPNNPDGVDRDPTALVDRGRTLTVIDEAFRDVTPDRSAVRLKGARTIVLKSLGKFHGLAGVRLGHAIGPGRVVEMLRSALGPWAVSGPALHVGRSVLLADPAPIIVDLSRRSARMRDLFDEHGVEVVGRTELFALTRWPDAARTHAALARAHVLSRRFDYRNDWIRFGLPPDAGFPKLSSALATVRSAEQA